MRRYRQMDGVPCMSALHVVFVIAAFVAASLTAVDSRAGVAADCGANLSTDHGGGFVTNSRAGRDAASGEEKKPVISWGFRERIRQAYILNGTDVDNSKDDDRNYIRVRSQLWLRLRPADGLELYTMLNNEHRHWLKPGKDFDINEFIVENLYVRAERIGGSPVTITAGRQNIMYGEGFLYMDGGPLDGSRTGYINAFRLLLEGEKRSLEMHVLSDPSRDEYLPRINSKRTPLIEWDEVGGGLRYTENLPRRMKHAAYYFYKEERPDGGSSHDANVNTWGGRVSGSPIERVDLAAEAAYQFGDRDSRNSTALGGYIHATCALQKPPGRVNAKLTAGILYLSGDDPVTPDFEGWNPLYARWPKWSELYIYTLAREEGVAYWSNLVAPHVGLSLCPAEGVELIGGVYAMSAPENAPGEPVGPGPTEWSPRPPFGAGKRRGMLSIVQMKWQYGEHLSGHLLWERFDPDDYYFGDGDTAHFLRWEIFFSY